MNDPRELARQAVDEKAARWLASGPDRAPAGLLTTSLERTLSSRQRPALVAAALGAPVVGAPARTAASVRLAVLVALTVLGLIAVVVFVGTARPDRLVVTTPSATPSRPSAPPQDTLPPLTPGPCMFSPGIPCSANVRDVVDQALGFAFDGGSGWVGVPDGYPSSRSFGHGQCWDNLCDKGYVTVSAFPTSDGFTVPAEQGEGGAPARHFDGTTLAELKRAWLKAYPDSAVDQTDVDAVPSIVVWTRTNLYILTIYRDRIFGFTSAGPFFASPRPASSLARDTNLSPFLSGFHFLVPPGIGRVGGIEVAAPEGWAITSTGLGLGMTGDGSFLGFAAVDVDVIDPGEWIRVYRPGAGTTLSFTATGTTIDELVASINQGVGDATASKATIAGVDGYRWAVPRRFESGALAAIAVFEWEGRFYVFQLNLPHEAPPGDRLGRVLDGVTLR